MIIVHNTITCKKRINKIKQNIAIASFGDEPSSSKLEKNDFLSAIIIRNKNSPETQAGEI